MTRSPEQVLKAHFDALQNGDVQALVADYADDAAIITAQGVMAGHNGIEAFLHRRVTSAARGAIRAAQRRASRGRSAVELDGDMARWPDQ
jgi:ketosteroid isomerase-like protein